MINSTLNTSFLKEVEQENNWDKSTLDYCINNPEKVKKIIRSASTSIRGTRLNIEELYSELVEFLLTAEDYSVFKRSDNISLEAYIAVCARNCLKRIIHTNKIQEAYLHPIEVEEAMQFIPDVMSTKAYEEIENLEIEEALRDLEYKRYYYGTDIFLTLYVKLLTINNKDKYKEIKKIIKIDIIPEIVVKDPDIVDLIKAITKVGIDKSITILESRVYSASIIKNAIESM